MQDRVKELEKRYRKYMLKFYFKILCGVAVVAVVVIGGASSFDMYLNASKEKQNIKEIASEQKLNFEQKLAISKKARLDEIKADKQGEEVILADENETKELDLTQDENTSAMIKTASLDENKSVSEVKAEPESKIKINSSPADIARLRSAFWMKPSYEKAILLAQMYLQNKDYNRTIYWSLKANDLNSAQKMSWEVFSKAKAMMGDANLSRKAMDFYRKHYEEGQ